MTENDSDVTYNYSYYSIEQSAFKQRVWDYWRHGCEECNGCPLRSPKLHPQHSAFDPTAEVMAIAEAPGEGRGGSREVESEKLEYDESEWDSTDIHPRFKAYDKDAAERWSIPRGDSWPYIHELLRKDRLQLGVTDVFFTNAIKCGKTNNDSDDKKARENCQTYLGYEIDELVQPSLVIAFGKHAIKAVENTLDIEIYSDNLKNTLNSGPSDTFPIFGRDIKIIPSYHWARLGPNIKQYLDWPDFEEIDDGYEKLYWDKLAEVIQVNLSKS